MIDIVDPRTGELMDTDSVPGLAAVAALHAEQLEALTEAVEQLGEDRSSQPDGRGPFVWAELDAQTAAKAWRDLAAWVGWLRGRYPLARQVPLCWWRHPELVEELTALWLAWREAYHSKDAPWTAAADWHGRWLPEFLRRVGAGGWNVACEGEHKERVAALYDARATDDPEAFQAFVALDAERRNPNRSTTNEKESPMLNEATIRTALESGEARMVGSLPGSPIAYRDSYWVPDEEGWIQVADEHTLKYLSDAEHRLALADEAIARAERS